ncbi:hypothetical protein HQS73_004013 [Salmonella enterica]|nr:hypothetical protein [Salmonella enterica]EJR2955495.1 hypothetical protein [Salmonella enterica]VEA48627.1 Uncharacterised protein [Salmonella enterica subsp. arizonae]
MFDFPQPGETYRSAAFPAVVVTGILADGIPWDLPYRCPGLVWNPYRRPYTILIRITSDGRVIELPLGRFLREFSCIRADLFKRNPENRYSVLKDIATDPVLQKWREDNIDKYPEEKISVIKSKPLAQTWRDIPGKQPDNSYRQYL